ncbi:hypothetical protein T01_11267 [Trichinella spiralis]|uniref:Uncharacterized protein n=1 Tax=Trichinella spiralis TaxID=6334 RepID=A0A0V1ALI5_TRISP|nr:hypothetical protein T01_11267 [Trichinella spiralis]
MLNIPDQHGIFHNCSCQPTKGVFFTRLPVYLNLYALPSYTRNVPPLLQFRTVPLDLD